jgi:hypothetical protein
VNAPFPGRNAIILTAPASRVLRNSLACARAGRARAADVIATFGTLNAWWEQTRQVAARYRPALVITDTAQDGPAPAAPQPSGGRA